MWVWRLSGLNVLNESGFKNTCAHTYTKYMHSYIRAHEHSYSRTRADDIHGQGEGSHLRNIILSSVSIFIGSSGSPIPSLPRAATSLQPPLGIGGIL